MHFTAVQYMFSCVFLLISSAALKMFLTQVSIPLVSILSDFNYLLNKCHQLFLINLNLRPKGGVLSLHQRKKSRMKQEERCFLCGRKGREFLCERVQSGRCFRQL